MTIFILIYYPYLALVDFYMHTQLPIRVGWFIFGINFESKNNLLFGTEGVYEMSVRSLELLLCYTYVRLIHRKFFFLLRADLLSKGYLVHHTCNLQNFQDFSFDYYLYLNSYIILRTKQMPMIWNIDNICRLLQQKKTSELSHETSP